MPTTLIMVWLYFNTFNFGIVLRFKVWHPVGKFHFLYFDYSTREIDHWFYDRNSTFLWHSWTDYGKLPIKSGRKRFVRVNTLYFGMGWIRSRQFCSDGVFLDLIAMEVVFVLILHWQKLYCVSQSHTAWEETKKSSDGILSKLICRFDFILNDNGLIK